MSSSLKHPTNTNFESEACEVEEENTDFKDETHEEEQENTKYDSEAYQEEQQNVNIYDDEYNVREKVKELNKDLANTPGPQGDRRTKIVFSESVAVAPPPDYPTTDEEDSVRSETPTRRESNSVLVERDGQFVLENRSEMHAKHGGFNFDDESPVTRPTSAPVRSTRKNETDSKDSYSYESEIRPVSAGNSCGYRSPYATVDPEKLERQRRRREERERKRQEEKEEEERQKRKDNEAAFKVWLQNKEAQAQREKEKQEEEERKEAEKARKQAEERSNPIKFEKWCQDKKIQAKKEKEMRRKQRQEEKECMQLRTSEENYQAFLKWLRKKNREAKQQEKLEMQRARITRLALRRCRKSQALAHALAVSSTTGQDYYGWR